MESKLKLVAEIMGMKLIKQDDTRFRLKGENPVYIFIHKTWNNDKQLNYSIQGEKFPNDTRSFYPKDYLNNREKLESVLDINIAKSKSAAQIAADIDRRLYDSYKLISEIYAEKLRQYNEREKRKNKIHMEYKAAGFEFYQHDNKTAHYRSDTLNCEVQFSYDFNSVYTMKVTNLDCNSPLDIAAYISQKNKYVESED